MMKPSGNKLEAFTVADLRCVTPRDESHIGLAFDTIEGEVIRIQIPLVSALTLSGLINEAIPLREALQGKP